MEIVALCGLLILGIVRFAPPEVLFSGFGHPALVTIVTVFFLSEGIISSGILHGLGQSIARKTHSLKIQVISIAAVSSTLSAFINNVGAIGLILPTATRMARRSGTDPSTFGLPLAFFSILGGTVTLIGSAPNIIIASFMFSATGYSFKMFDFAPHGLAMLLSAFSLWLVCIKCGAIPGLSHNGKADNGKNLNKNTEDLFLDEIITFAPFSTYKRRVTFIIITVAIIFVSLGQLYPAYGFGGAAILMTFFGIINLPEAYGRIDLKIILFLGAMLSIGNVLEYTGSLDNLLEPISKLIDGSNPFWLVLLLLYFSSVLSNAINNSAAAVFMAPLAIGIASGSNLETGAALMAVAAGSNLTLILPTHQATLMVISKAPFKISSFMRFGLLLTVVCGLSAATVITYIWS